MGMGAVPFGAEPFGGPWSKPKITYTRANGDSVTKTFSKFPLEYTELPRFKKAHTESDSGVIETDVFHHRVVYRLRFEMLEQSEADWIVEWFHDRAVYGYSFTFYRFADSSPGVTCIWNPADNTPNVAPMPENPSLWFTWDVEFFEELT